MIRSDNHVHSSFSTDSSTPMADICKQAERLKLSSICFTDHMDYEFPEKYNTSFDSPKDNRPIFTFDPELYFHTVKVLQEQFPALDLRTGVELGLKKTIQKQTTELTSSYPFDFVIGSTHLVDDTDPYYPEFWDDFGEEKGILSYYETTLEHIKSGFDFDVYGHIDYILRYCPTIRRSLKNRIPFDRFFTQVISEHAELLREILSLLIRSGKGIEINTAGFKYGLGHPNPHETLISYYKELGGEIISIGSDAHEPKYLCFDFPKIPDILRQAGFSYYTEFHKRTPVQVPLP